MPVRLPLQSWLRKVEAALSDEDCAGFAVIRVIGQSEDGDEETEEVSSLEGIKDRPGLYRLVDDNGKTLSECRVSSGGVRLGRAGGPDPMSVGARSMAMLSEGWANLTNAQERALSDKERRIAALEKERDEWKERYLETLLEADEDKDENAPLYALLTTALGAYMARDEKAIVLKHANALLPRIPEGPARDAVVAAINAQLQEIKAPQLAASEDA